MASSSSPFVRSLFHQHKLSLDGTSAYPPVRYQPTHMLLPAYAPGTGFHDQPTRCPPPRLVQGPRPQPPPPPRLAPSARSSARSPTLSAYALATELSYHAIGCAVLSDAIGLRACCAMPGTDLAYAARSM
eukprot:2735340-Rhodomonas_salina.1